MGKNKQYKGIPLDRKQLNVWIKDFANERFNECEVQEIQQNKDIHYNCKIRADGEEIILDLYFLQDGKTTLSPKNGKHQEVKVELADYIVKKVKHYDADAKNMSFSIDNLEKSDFDELIEYMDQLPGVEKAEHVRHEANTSDRYRYTNTMGDKITLIYYDKKKLQIQGKPLILYSEVTAFLSAFIDFDQVIKNQEEFLDVEIDAVNVREEMREILPTAYEILGDKLKKVLASSFALQKSDYPFEEFTPIAFPALRALEGYLNMLLNENDIFEENFGKVFNKEDNRFVMLRKHRVKMHETLIEATEEIYDYFSKHRHTLFHAGGIDATIRIIETRHEADLIVANVLKLIETTHRKTQLVYPN